MNYGVRVILEQIEVEAENRDNAEEIAINIYESDGLTRLNAGMLIADFEVEELE